MWLEPTALFWMAMDVCRVSKHKVLGMLCGLLAWAFGSFGVGFASAGRSGDVRTTRCAQSTDAEGPVPALRFLGDPDLMQPQPEVSEEVQGAEFQSRLKILKEAMSKYGG